MANICCDDVIFYTEGNPEGLYDLWEDLETYIILNQNPDLCWIGNLFSHNIYIYLKMLVLRRF